ncbi:MAG: hypothetical protein ACFB50_07270 [Rubrobacteraceae bacterium]
MSENSSDRSGGRRRMGPLGGEEETRRQVPGQVPGQVPEEEAQTRSIPERQAGGAEAHTRASTTRSSGGGTRNHGGSTRSMQAVEVQGTPGTASGGYFEAMQDREERLREIYGGTDWLASFLGFVFALVGGGALVYLYARVLVPLGLPVDFGDGALGTSATAGLISAGVVLFLMYFFGGYVSGRLARFDGGLNGLMLVLWTAIAGVLLFLAGGVFSGVLPAGISENIQGLIQGTVSPTFDNLVGQGTTGTVILAAAVLIILVGAFVGGRTGGRYHRDIDYTL